VGRAGRGGTAVCPRSVASQVAVMCDALIEIEIHYKHYKQPHVAAIARQFILQA
jgi:hypothetical protein